MYTKVLKQDWAWVDVNIGVERYQEGWIHPWRIISSR